MNLLYLLLLLIIIYIIQQRDKIIEGFQAELRNEQILKLKLVERKEPIITIYKNNDVDEKQIFRPNTKDLLNVNGLFIDNVDNIKSIKNKEQSLYYTDVNTYMKNYKNYKVLTICNVPKQILLISKNDISLVNDREENLIGYINDVDKELFTILLKSQKNYIDMNNYKFVKVTKDNIVSKLFTEDPPSIDIFIYFDTVLNPLYSELVKQDLNLVPYDFRIASNNRDLAGMSLNNNILKFYLPYTKKRIQTITLSNEESTSDNTNIIYNTILIDTLIFSFNSDDNVKYNKNYLYLLNYFNEFVKINYYIQHLEFLKITKEWSINKQKNATFKNVMEGFKEKGKPLKFKIDEKNIIAHKKQINGTNVKNIVTFKVNKKLIDGVPIKGGDKLYTETGFGNFEETKFYYVVKTDSKYVYVKDRLKIVIPNSLYSTRKITQQLDKILLNKGLIKKYKLEENDMIYFMMNGKIIMGKIVKDDKNKLFINIDKTDPNNEFMPQFRCYQDNTILSKTECTGTVDRSGNEKPSHNWDRPCISNNECPFYLKNKNYTNERGGCNNGYCEFPVGVKRLSYREYDKKFTEANFPRCNGCDINDGIDCCEKQEKDKKMNGPNYVFKNDNEDRRLSKFF